MDAGRKRAGTWLGTDIDLDQFRSSKRFKGQVGAARYLLATRPTPCRTAGVAGCWLDMHWHALCPAVPNPRHLPPARTSKAALPSHWVRQEIAWDLGTLHLAGGAPAAGPASTSVAAAAAAAATAASAAVVATTAAPAAAAAAAGGPSPDPPDSPMLSVDTAGSPMRPSQSQGWPAAQAMQCTPRSESRTPSVHAGHAGAAAGQPSVQSAGLRSRLAVGHTPVRLSDALGLQLLPTSPSDPALEGQTDLRKVRLGEDAGLRRAG